MKRLSLSLRNPTQHAYQRLVEAIATEAPRPDGYRDARQLPPLTRAQRATILRANPDALNDFEFDPTEFADVLEGTVDARLWVSACAEGVLRRWLFLDVATECEAQQQLLAASRYDAPEVAADGRLP